MNVVVSMHRSSVDDDPKEAQLVATCSECGARCYLVGGAGYAAPLPEARQDADEIGWELLGFIENHEAAHSPTNATGGE